MNKLDFLEYSHIPTCQMHCFNISYTAVMDRQTRGKRNRSEGPQEVMEQGNKNSRALSSTNLIMNNILHAPVQYRMVSSVACRKGSAGLLDHIVIIRSPLKHKFHWPGNTEKLKVRFWNSLNTKPTQVSAIGMTSKTSIICF